MGRRLNANAKQAGSKGAPQAPSDLRLTGTIDFAAAEGEGESDGGLPKFSMLANTGAPMEVDGWYWPVVIDLAGASFAKSPTPCLEYHDRRRRLGHTIKQDITTGRKGKIAAQCVVSSTSEEAKQWVADGRNGFPFEVSVGARVQEADFIDAGETVRVNDRTFKGPLYVARKTIIRELTADVLGADAKTVAKIAANQKDHNPMFEEWLKANGLDLETLSDESRTKLEASFKKQQAAEQRAAELEAAAKKKPKRRRAADDVDDDEPEPADDNGLAKRRELEAAESERVDTIRATFARYPTVETVDPAGDGKAIKASTFKANAIRKGMSVQEVELVLLKASTPGEGNDGPAIHITPPVEGPLYSEALACAIARDRFGMPSSIEARDKKYGYEHQFSQKVLEASDDRRIRRPSLHYLMDLVIQAAQGVPYTGDRKSNDFQQAYVEAAIKVQGGPRVPRDIRASGPFSTLTVAHVLENVGNKVAEQRFAMMKVAWPDIAQVKDLNDFKPHSLYRLDENLGYLEVGPDGTLKHGTLTDTKKTVQASTWGRMIALTRQHIRNDDLSVFDQLIIGLVEGSAWAKEAELAALLLSMISGGTFFSLANNNLIDDDLGIAGITHAEQEFSDHTSTKGKPIMAEPDRVLVGTQDGLLAQDIFGKSNLLASTANANQTFVENPHRGKYKVVKWGYLSNTAIRKPDGTALSGQNSDQWLLLGNPQLAAALILGALDGRVTPFIESGETSFDTLGMQWRGYDDWGVGEGDTQAAVCSSGDGGSS